jgi:hypothetical protein
MRRVDNLIKMIRQHCAQVNFETDSSGNPVSGITDELILEYLNDGQDLLQSRIIETYPKAFVESVEISITGAEEYDIDDNVIFNNKILFVEYSSTGQAKDYYPIDQITLRERDLITVRDVDSYARRKGKILPSPIATNTSAKLRVWYHRSLDDLDIRRGVISSVSSGSITMNTGATLDDTGIFSREDYVCLVDSLGVVKNYGIQIISYSSPVLTTASFVNAASAGDFVVVGKYATTHSDLPVDCERFLKAYGQLRVFESTNSRKASAESDKVETMLSDIVNSFTEEDHDIKHPPIIDPDLFT